MILKCQNVLGTLWRRESEAQESGHVGDASVTCNLLTALGEAEDTPFASIREHIHGGGGTSTPLKDSMMLVLCKPEVAEGGEVVIQVHDLRVDNGSQIDGST